MTFETELRQRIRAAVRALADEFKVPCIRSYRGSRRARSTVSCVCGATARP